MAKKTERQREWIGEQLLALSLTITGLFVSLTGKDASHEQLRNLEAVLSLRSRAVQLVPLAKHRVTYHRHGVAMEQTDIAVEGTVEGTWRSICLEGELEEIKKLLQTAVTVPVTALNSGATAFKEVCLGDYLTEVSGSPCGYPEFVLRLQRSMEQPAAA